MPEDPGTVDDAPNAPEGAPAEGTAEAPADVNWQQPSAEQIAWAAGLFEGEGCVALTTLNEGRQKYLQLTLASTDQDIVKRFQRTVGVGHIYGKKPRLSRHKPQWQWRCTRRDEVNHVRDLLLPHLGKRRTERWVECDALKSAPLRRSWVTGRKELHA